MVHKSIVVLQSTAANFYEIKLPFCMKYMYIAQAESQVANIAT